jgi:hypothetical protein
MYSYQSFTPGSRSNTSRIINYIAEANAVDGTINTCYCVPDKYDKNTPGSDAASARVSYATKIAQIIKSKKGGTPQYGNFYLGQPLNVNYLGRIEGMPGGGGFPPKNRF